MLATNYAGVDVIIAEIDDQASYDFIVHNDGDMVLWGLQFPTYDLLGPSCFGLDDTHMPSSLTDEPNAHIECLRAKESAIIHREKWGTLEKYRGYSTGSIYMTFSPFEDGSVRYGLRANFTIRKRDGSTFVAAPPKLELIRPTSYRRGYAFGKWLKRIFKKLHLSR